MDQKAVLIAREGDAWFARNEQALNLKEADPVVQAIIEGDLNARSVLEVGASNGWRLDILGRMGVESLAGLDPSASALEDGSRRFPHLDLKQGTADSLPYPDHSIDLVIYGFCLYLADREDLFRIAAEGDRVLRDGGHLVIYDFYVQTAHRRSYRHDDSIYCFKMDHSKIFLANPAYRTVSVRSFGSEGKAALSEDEAAAVIVLKKDYASAFPLRSVDPSR